MFALIVDISNIIAQATVLIGFKEKPRKIKRRIIKKNMVSQYYDSFPVRETR
jgi:hypothetical protein